MPKALGNDKAVRSAMLSDELDEHVSEPVDIAPTPVAVAYAPEVPVVPTVVASPPDMAQLIQMLAAAMQQNGLATADAIKTGLAEATTMAREPIPENKVAPGFSVYGQPEGDRAKPRTKLLCPMFLGVVDAETGQVTPAFEIFEDACTELERRMLNQLRAGVVPVRRNDDAVANVTVAARVDAAGTINRITLGFPALWLSKDEQAQMPSQRKILEQLTASAA